MRELIITLAPACTNRVATAKPIPRLPPVTSAVLPSSESSIPRALHGVRRVRPGPPSTARHLASMSVNRLADETSPYLRQHAGNPVEWYPWGEEALRLAREQDLPLFVSIGYASCHWCHVMAHESFEDPATAADLSNWFVSVKVDREERPDLDAVYMAATQAMTGSGGWPMSVFCTPDGLPFYAGTYFPPGRTSWDALLPPCRPSSRGGVEPTAGSGPGPGRGTRAGSPQGDGSRRVDA